MNTSFSLPLPASNQNTIANALHRLLATTAALWFAPQVPPSSCLILASTT